MKSLVLAIERVERPSVAPLTNVLRQSANIVCMPLPPSNASQPTPTPSNDRCSPVHMIRPSMVVSSMRKPTGMLVNFEFRTMSMVSSMPVASSSTP